MSTFFKYLAAALAGAAAAFILFYFIAAGILVDAVLTGDNPDVAVPVSSLSSGVYAEGWPDDAQLSKMRIAARDGAQLTALICQNPNGGNRWAIVVHGYSSKKENMRSYACRYYEKGYSVLLPDLRANGESGGEYVGMGWTDRFDLIDWVNLIISWDSNAEIVMHGVSMGASAVLMASGEGLPENVRAVISDCAYTNAEAILSSRLSCKLGKTCSLLAPGSSLITRLKAGYYWSEASALTNIAKSHTPTLFIHGEDDKIVPVEMAHRLYRAASCRKDILIIDGAGHAESAKINAEKYWSTVFDFIAI